MAERTFGNVQSPHWGEQFFLIQLYLLLTLWHTPGWTRIPERFKNEVLGRSPSIRTPHPHHAMLHLLRPQASHAAVSDVLGALVHGLSRIDGDALCPAL